MSKENLSLKHNLFIDNLIKNKFNIKKAYLETYPDSSEISADTNAYRLAGQIGIDRIQQEIAEKMKELDVKKYVTIELILMNLLKIALDPKVKPADRNRSLELLGRYLAMFTDKSENKSDVDIHYKQQILQWIREDKPRAELT